MGHKGARYLRAEEIEDGDTPLILIGEEFSLPTHLNSKHFPFKCTSPKTKTYNCIAWAAGRQDIWIEPPAPLLDYKSRKYFWPDGVEKEDTLDAYRKAYESKEFGFEVCANGDLEDGYEKIALYFGGVSGVHATRQLHDGKWTSKLGDGVDASHTLETLMDGEYGDVLLFMRRKGVPARNPYPRQPYRRTRAKPKKRKD